MASPPYKLGCVLYGHTLDVRCITVTDDNNIISGSRDRTAKIWKPNSVNAGYFEAETLTGHTNFVSCVCYLPPDAGNINGLILTGSNDHTICVYDLLTCKVIYVLKGHSNTVCCLSPGVSQGTVLSASWDNSAKFWSTDGSNKPLASLVGHQAAIWSVIQLTSGTIVTGSADKTIKIWSRVGDCLITFTGHTDCVRALAAATDTTFLSASNDATIRLWNATTGACIKTFYGHTNYIYSISVYPGAGADCFITSGEDRSIRVWQGGECEQVIALPAQSIWAVAIMNNGDVAAGSSDGVVRVFSADPSRQADPQLQKLFEEEVASLAASTQQDLGGIKVDQLPGPDALSMPGNKDGQTKMIREGDSVIAYSWSDSAQEWLKVGDVMGASGGSQATSGKQLHAGKEYDYVFSVDIEEGKPPLKLPYNLSEDPWAAAQKFIHDNDLSQMFLDQVANFIVTNSQSQSSQLSQLAPSGYCDPLTGGNRYIPGGASVGAPGADPFTGATRYLPPGTSAAATNGETSMSRSMTSIADCPTRPYFPQKTYLRFDQANLGLILEKLQEFNSKTGDGVHQVSECHLEGVVKLADPESRANPLHLGVLRQLLEWPNDIVFPVLDVTRLAVRGAEVNQDLCSGESGDLLFKIINQNLLPKAIQANQMLALRIVCNMLSHPPGEKLALRHCDHLLSTVLDWSPPFTKNMQVALTTLLLNLAVAIERTKAGPARTRGVKIACTVLPRLSDAEALFRGLVAVGTLVWDAETASEQDELKRTVREAADTHAMLTRLSQLDGNKPGNESKAANCAAQVLALVEY